MAAVKFIEALSDGTGGLFVALTLSALIPSLSLKLKIKPIIGMSLYWYHVVISVIFAIYVLENGGDAQSYYEGYGLEGHDLLIGTSLIAKIVQQIRQLGGLSFISTSIVFGLIGAFGIILLYSALRDVSSCSRWGMIVANICCFIPGIHFWSSGIGKDGIAFTAASLVVWSSGSVKHRSLVSGVGVLLMLLVRPHVAGLLAMQWTLALLTSRKAGLMRSGVVATLCLILAGVMTLRYANVDDLSGALERWQAQGEFNTFGGSSFDVSSRSLPELVFGYLFLPLWGGDSFVWRIASVENWFILLLTFAGVVRFVFRGTANSLTTLLPSLAFVLGVAIVFAPVTANLGIASRQRTMLMPAILYLALRSIASSPRLGTGVR
jgi:hypothetical protein